MTVDPADVGSEPPVGRGTVDPARTADGDLDVLVVGDYQVQAYEAGDRAWPEHMERVLRERLARSHPRLGLSVSVLQGEALDAEQARAIVARRLAKDPADLVLLCLGSYDGEPRRWYHRPIRIRGAVPAWVTTVRSASLRADRPGGPFYASEATDPRVPPEAHVVALRELMRIVERTGALPVFVEQPTRGSDGRTVVPTTAGRLVPWISTVQALEMAGNGSALFKDGSPFALSGAGHEQLGTFVAWGVVQFVP